MATSRVLEVAGREVTITHPDKPLFRSAGYTKIDLVNYYLAVADGALRGVAGRPMILKRFVKGLEEEAFFRSGRRPTGRDGWTSPSSSTPPAPPPKKWSYATRPAWPG